MSRQDNGDQRLPYGYDNRQEGLHSYQPQHPAPTQQAPPGIAGYTQGIYRQHQHPQTNPSTHNYDFVVMTPTYSQNKQGQQRPDNLSHGTPHPFSAKDLSSSAHPLGRTAPNFENDARFGYYPDPTYGWPPGYPPIATSIPSYQEQQQQQQYNYGFHPRAMVDHPRIIGDSVGGVVAPKLPSSMPCIGEVQVQDAIGLNEEDIMHGTPARGSNIPGAGLGHVTPDSNTMKFQRIGSPQVAPIQYSEPHVRLPTNENAGSEGRGSNFRIVKRHSLQDRDRTTHIAPMETNEISPQSFAISSFTGPGSCLGKVSTDWEALPVAPGFEAAGHISFFNENPEKFIKAKEDNVVKGEAGPEGEVKIDGPMKVEENRSLEGLQMEGTNAIGGIKIGRPSVIEGEGHKQTEQPIEVATISGNINVAKPVKVKHNLAETTSGIVRQVIIGSNNNIGEHQIGEESRIKVVSKSGQGTLEEGKLERDSKVRLEIKTGNNIIGGESRIGAKDSNSLASTHTHGPIVSAKSQQITKANGSGKEMTGEGRTSKTKPVGQAKPIRVVMDKPEPVPIVFEEMPLEQTNPIVPIPPMSEGERMRRRLEWGLDKFKEFEDNDIASDSDIDSDDQRKAIAYNIRTEKLRDALRLDVVMDEYIGKGDSALYDLDTYKRTLKALDKELLAAGVRLSGRVATKRLRREAKWREKKKRKQWLIQGLISDTSSDESNDEYEITDDVYKAMLVARKHHRKRQKNYQANKEKITRKSKDYTRRMLLHQCKAEGIKGRKYTCTIYTPLVDLSSEGEFNVDSDEAEEIEAIFPDDIAVPIAPTPTMCEHDVKTVETNESSPNPSIKLVLKKPKFLPIRRPVKTEEELAEEAEKRRFEQQQKEQKESEDKRKRLWQQIVRRDIPKGYSQMVRTHNTTVANARKYALICQKELLMRKDIRRMGSKSTRMTKETQGRARRLMKEVLGYWRKHEKEERENRRKAEKEALERQKMEDERREAKRQQKKLNFLITQTELYAHFMGGKAITDGMESVEEHTTTEGAVDIEVDDYDEEDEHVMRERARIGAEKAMRKHQEKTMVFDEQAAHAGTKRKKENVQFTQEEFDNEMNFANPQMESEQLLPQPTSFLGSLKSYQIKGMSWLANLYDQGINGILADEMGLGKTVQTIALLSYLADYQNIWGPFLIVAPLSTVHNWQQEFEKFNPSFKVLPYWGKPDQRKLIRKDWTNKQIHSKDATFHVLITSYNFVVQDDKYFQRVNWQYMILDEAQAIKSSSSTRWKSLLAMNCRNRLLLTGTPIQNSMAELWALLHFIMPTLFDSHDEFNEWFSKDIESHAEKNSGLDQVQLKRLHMILKPFMLRRLKRDVQHELGEKIEIEVECGMTSQQRRLYAALRDKIKLEDLLTSHVASSKTAQEQMNKHLMNLVMQFRKVCNHPTLFERKSVESPLVFSIALTPHTEEADVTTGGRNNFSLDVVTTNRNPISYRIPQLLFDEVIQLGPQSRRPHLLYNQFSLYMPYVIHKDSFPLDNDASKSSQLHRSNYLEAYGNQGLSLLRLVDLSPGEATVVAMGNLAQRLLLLAVQLERNKIRCYSSRRTILLPPRVQPIGSGASAHLVKVSERLLVTYSQLFGQLRRYLPKAIAAPVDYWCSSRSFANSQQQLRLASTDYTRLLLTGHHRCIQDANQWWTPLTQLPSRVGLVDPMTSVPFPLAGDSILPNHGLLLGATPPQGWTPLLVPDKYVIIRESDKMMMLDRLLIQLKKDDHRVLIYSQMTRMIDLLEEYMQLRQHKYMRLDGSTKVEDRRDMVAGFQNHTDVFCFLLSTRAGGLGINLTAADTVIFYDSDWNPTVDQQAMDRAHRVGQTRQVTVYRLVTKGTIEERILQRAKQKSEIQNMVISGGNYKGGIESAPKPSEVVSLLLDDKDMEEKFRRQKAEKKRQEKEAREKERARKKEKRRVEIERRREEAAKRRAEARAAKARPRTKRKRPTTEGDGTPAVPPEDTGREEGGSLVTNPPTTPTPTSESQSSSAFTITMPLANQTTTKISNGASAFSPIYGKPPKKRATQKK
eukprot:Ihof_evm1s373 gene=Ihof_evmTU1s373